MYVPKFQGLGILVKGAAVEAVRRISVTKVFMEQCGAYPCNATDEVKEVRMCDACVLRCAQDVPRERARPAHLEIHRNSLRTQRRY